MGNMRSYAVPRDLSPELCAQEASARRNWQFIKLDDHRLAWERGEINGCATRVGFFNNLAECIVDAKAHGFDEMKLERRKVPRKDAQ